MARPVWEGSARASPPRSRSARGRRPASAYWVTCSAEPAPPTSTARPARYSAPSGWDCSRPASSDTWSPGRAPRSFPCRSATPSVTSRPSPPTGASCARRGRWGSALATSRPPALRPNKTKIVATIGPACDAPAVLERMVRAGMNVARLNFSHGTFDEHGARIERLRAAARAAGQEIALMADLPGPKMRIGKLAREPILLVAGATFTLTTRDMLGGPAGASMTFPRLPQVVRAGDRLFLNDAIIQLVVERVDGPDVHCRVLGAGELRSRKGPTLARIDRGTSAFTDRDRQCLRFALSRGVDAVSQSFVESAADIRAVRETARSLGAQPLILAKIERS